MVFISPSWVPPLGKVPDSVPLTDFMFDEQHGRAPLETSLDPYVDALTGKRISAEQQRARVSCLSQALAVELGWEVNTGTEFSKVAGIFALNTIDIPTICWAILRLNGVATPANAAFTAEELASQLKSSEAQALFTVFPLLDVAVTAARQAGLPPTRVFICEMPHDNASKYPRNLKTLSWLIERGRDLDGLEPIRWTPGQGARQTAFLCYSSGTSGLPKGVMISHRNVIANTLQITGFESDMRKKLGGPDYRDTVLGLLPQSHIYGLVVISHLGTYRGDSVIILPKFDLKNFLTSIQTYKINTLFLVPPLIITMVNNVGLCNQYDLSSVKSIFTGAAPLGKEIAERISEQYPNWAIRQGYGTTETCTVVCSSVPNDLWFGSSGSLLPGYVAKVMSADGQEITTYDEPGELYVSSPTITLGYFRNPDATSETFVSLADGRYMRTGDEVMFRKAPSGNEHIWIVDRIKELIKVKVSVRFLRPSRRAFHRFLRFLRLNFSDVIPYRCDACADHNYEGPSSSTS